MSTLPNEFGDVIGGDKHFEGVVVIFFIFVEVDLDKINDHNFVRKKIPSIAWTSSSLPKTTQSS